MTKELISYYSWTAMLGLIITVVGAVAGLAVAGAVAADPDVAAVPALEWGAVAGMVLGSAAEAFLIARKGAPLLTRCLVSPGACVAVPLLGSAALNGEFVSAVPIAASVVAVSSLSLEAVRHLILRHTTRRRSVA